MKTIAALLLALSLAGCAGLRESAESTDTFAVCKAADIATTAYALRTGMFVEKNPLVSAVISHGYFPLVAVSLVIWYALDKWQNKTATLAANAITCPVAAHNLFLILK